MSVGNLLFPKRALDKAQRDRESLQTFALIKAKQRRARWMRASELGGLKEIGRYHSHRGRTDRIGAHSDTCHWNLRSSVRTEKYCRWRELRHNKQMLDETPCSFSFLPEGLFALQVNAPRAAAPAWDVRRTRFCPILTWTSINLHVWVQMALSFTFWPCLLCLAKVAVVLFRSVFAHTLSLPY